MSDTYHTLPGLRWSQLSRMLVSPLAYRRWQHDALDSAALRKGRALHSVVLGGPPVVTYDGRRAGKEWAAFQAEHPDATILIESERAAVSEMAAAIFAHAAAQDILATCDLREHTLAWEEGGRPAKCRLDAAGSGRLVDVKSTRDISEHKFNRAIRQYYYMEQLAWYRRGMRANGLACDSAYLIAVEPGDAGVYLVTSAMLDDADRRIDRLLATLAQCEMEDVWPGKLPVLVVADPVVDFDMIEEEE